MQTSLFEKMRAMEGDNLTREERYKRDVHFSLQKSKWQMKTAQWPFFVDKEEQEMLKTQFQNEMFRRYFPEDVIENLQKRWDIFDMDSVTKIGVILGDIFIPFYNEELVEKNEEIGLRGGTRLEGSEDLVMSDVERFDWFPRVSDNTIFGVRDKIPGRYCWFSEGKMYPMGIDVGKDCPLEQVEEWGGRYYIIRPYMMADCQYGGVKFWSHPFFSPRQFVSALWSEGVMFLTTTGELRSKYVPTVDIMLEDGVWEVKYEKGKIEKMRPRPGKRGGAVANLYVQATPLSLLRKNNRSFEVRKGMGAGKMLTMVEGDVEIRMGRMTPVGDEDKVHREGGEDWRKVEFSSQKIEGSKVVFFCDEGYLLYQEEGKLLDFVGGKIELGETPMEALVREVNEELHIVMKPEAFIPIGETSDSEARTFVFISHISKRWIGSVLVPYDGVASSVQPWVSRIMDYVVLTHGSMAIAGMRATSTIDPEREVVWEIYEKWRCGMCRLTTLKKKISFEKYGRILRRCGLKDDGVFFWFDGGGLSASMIKNQRRKMWKYKVKDDINRVLAEFRRFGVIMSSVDEGVIYTPKRGPNLVGVQEFGPDEEIC